MSERLNILITGGAGFIGSELAHQAVEEGFNVTVVDNLLNGRRENLEDLIGERLRLVVGDIRDTALMKSLMHGVEAVYHLACLCLRHSIHSPQENHEINASATLQLLAIARQAEVKRFVYTSSAEVYGSACAGALTEENALRPTNVYGAAKLAAESYARAYHVCYGLPAVILRLFNVYGPRCHHEGDCGEVIPKFLLRALAGKPLIVFGDGNQTRDFNYVSDTARAILKAGTFEQALGQTLNIGCGRETSINDLAKIIVDVVGNPHVEIRHDCPRPGDIARMCGNGDKAREILDCSPRVPLPEGLGKLKEWYLSHPSSLDSLLEEDVVHNWIREKIRKAASSRL